MGRDHWNTPPKAHGDFPIECRRVRYMKGNLLDAQPTSEERSYLAYAYKPPRFADEHEYRLVLMTGGSPPVPRESPHWNIDMGRRLPYVDLIGPRVTK